MLVVQNLSKSFKSHTVLKDISFKVNEGEVLTIIGPSGSGKSTLLRCLNYLEKPEVGIITIKDKSYNCSNMTPEEIYELRRFSSMVFQNYNLFQHRSVLENISDPLINVKKFKEKEARQIGIELLSSVGLAGKENQYPRQLSGGQQQRVGIVRALAMRPLIMLFDEPTSSLDPELVKEVLLVIKKLSERRQTMLIVTHEMEFAKNISDKVLFIDQGKIVEKGNPAEVFNSPSSERLQEFLDALNLKDL